MGMIKSNEKISYKTTYSASGNQADEDSTYTDIIVDNVDSGE